MNRRSRLFGFLVCAAAVAIAGCASNGNVAPAGGSATMATAHARYIATLSAARPLGLSGVKFSYFNGPVLVDPKVYLIFWGYKKAGDPEGVAKLLQSYIGAMGGSSHNNILTQYYEIVGSKTNYITNPKNQLGGVWFDEKNPIPPEPTDAQVAAEALNGVARFGYDASGSYVVALAHNHGGQGFGSQWCAYHSATYSGSELVSYTNLPYIPDAVKACGAGAIKPPADESGKDEGVTIVESTMEAESVTDPNPGEGWYNLVYGEIGDPCKGIANEKFGNKSFAVKALYSNASEKCVQRYK